MVQFPHSSAGCTKTFHHGDGKGNKQLITFQSCSHSSWNTTQIRLLVLQHGISWEMGCGNIWILWTVGTTASLTYSSNDMVERVTCVNTVCSCWSVKGDCLESILMNHKNIPLLLMHLLQKQKLPISSTNWYFRFSDLDEICLLQD